MASPLLPEARVPVDAVRSHLPARLARVAALALLPLVVGACAVGAATRAENSTPGPIGLATELPASAATPTLVAASPTPPPATATPTPTPAAAPSPTPDDPPTPAARREPDDLDRAIQAAIGDRLFPGAVVLIGRDGAVVKQAAYGHAQLYADKRTRLAQPVPARVDTIYDLASLTKLFTATYVLQLVEEGRLDLDRPVASYLPAFAANGKAGITVRQLLNHTSGLPAGLPLATIPGGSAERLAAVAAVRPTVQPGARRLYSDLNFITLGQLVETVSGQSLAEYGQARVFGPLGMKDTSYNPPASLRERIAATEYEPFKGRGMVHGEVHDNAAWALGGVAGNAGLFSTASDLARFATAILDGGALAGARILEPESVRAMTTLADPGDDGGLGWEIGQAWYMGSLSSPRAWGHTGYTGTSLVIDASRRTVVVLLTNRVHPTAQGPSINAVRRLVADAALRLSGSSPTP